MFGFGGGIFDPNKSDSFKAIGDPDKPENITIGSSEFQGYRGSDTIKLKSSNQNELVVNDFEFFLVTHVTHWDKGVRVDGIIGLSAIQDSDTSGSMNNLLD